MTIENLYEYAHWRDSCPCSSRNITQETPSQNSCHFFWTLKKDMSFRIIRRPVVSNAQYSSQRSGTWLYAYYSSMIAIQQSMAYMNLCTLCTRVCIYVLYQRVCTLRVVRVIIRGKLRFLCVAVALRYLVIQLTLGVLFVDTFLPRRRKLRRQNTSPCLQNVPTTTRSRVSIQLGSTNPSVVSYLILCINNNIISRLASTCAYSC